MDSDQASGGARLTRRAAMQIGGAVLALPAAGSQPAFSENRRMAFEPKFVDLVRNYTTTTGTADFKLGTAMNGYRPFNTALQVGDQFYYSAIGVDKPAETEVGRGTLLAGSTVQRDPIGGTKTNFTAGTKSVALIAAAEWFGAAQQLAGSVDPDPALNANSDAKLPTQRAVKTYVDGRVDAAQLTPVADHEMLAASKATAAYLRAPGLEGVFVFDPANHAAHVAADGARGIFVPPAGQDGSTGAWVRQFEGHALARWWGVKGDGTINDFAALSAALATLRAMRDQFSIYGNGSSFPLEAHGDIYLGANTVTIDWPAHIIGHGSGVPGGMATKFRVDNGNTAFSFTYPGSPGWILERCTIDGSFNKNSHVESESHGVNIDRPGTLRDVQIINFGGDGIYVDTSVPTDNANGFKIQDVHVSACRRGIYTHGSDSNGGTITGLYAFGNRQAGIYENSFLGNYYSGFLLESNSRGSGWNGTANRPCQYAHNNGHWFACVRGQEAWCSTNSPPTTASSNQGWAYYSEGGVVDGIPQWVSGLNVRAGGGVIQAGASNRSIFVGGYIEGDETNQIDQNGLVLQTQGSNEKTFFQVTGGVLNSAGQPPAMIEAAANGVFVPGKLAVGRGLAVTVANSLDGVTFTGASGFNMPVTYKTGNTTVQYNFQDSSGAVFGSWIVNSGLQATYFDHLQGSGSFNFRVGTTATTVATINGTGFKVASGTLGYGTGAGGAVTQASSRTSGVTLNKACGQITLVAAPGSTSWQTFTVTNSTVTAADTVRVCQASGADAYMTHVTNVSAGSFRITFATTGGTTTEQPVFSFAVIKGAIT